MIFKIGNSKAKEFPTAVIIADSIGISETQDNSTIVNFYKGNDIVGIMLLNKGDYAVACNDKEIQ
jgi:hypothetical protein